MNLNVKKINGNLFEIYVLIGNVFENVGRAYPAQVHLCKKNGFELRWLDWCLGAPLEIRVENQ